MADFSTGDILFIILILAVIHGIMQIISYLRRCKARQHPANGE
jgi:hypothetical protein